MFDAIDLSEYADPVLYDSENTAFEPDGPFYLRRCWPACAST